MKSFKPLASPLTLRWEATPVFKGFDYTVAEGQRLSNQSYTELPEFVQIATNTHTKGTL